jgi:Zn-dependent protease
LQQIIQNLILIIPGFLIAITVHELAHGYIALRFGDPTAKLAGRITFNPLSHLDPYGTLALILSSIAGMGIGWAKPVPVDPRYLRDPRKDMIWISLGGPGANIAVALILSILLHIILLTFYGKPVGPAVKFVVEPLVAMLVFGVQINVVLAIFNLLPIPPLDGSSILSGLLPTDLSMKYEELAPYGFMILLLLIITGVLHFIIVPPVKYIMGFMMSLAGF